MYSAIGYLIGVFSGSLFVTCVVYALCRWIIGKLMPNKISLSIVSYLLSFVILLIISLFTHGINYKVLLYAIELLIWLAMDIVQFKKDKLKEGN